jgi:hypothetical protein
MADNAVLQAILIRQAGQTALLRALIASHPDRGLLLQALEYELRLGESLGLNSTQIPDSLREAVENDIKGWIKVAQQPPQII